MQSNEKIRYNSNYNSQQNLSTGLSHKPLPVKIISERDEKVLNIVNFINQKHKFKIQNFFDQRAAKKFLESKDIAMKEIYLDDEIICTKSLHKISDEIMDKKKKKKRAKTKKIYKYKKPLSCQKIIYLRERKLKKVKTEKNLKILSDIYNNYEDKNKNLNNFYFSRISRKLMTNDDDINVSSISNGVDN